MNPFSIQEIYAAKVERRKRLAHLSIDEKIDLIEKLRELGKTMLEARASLPKAHVQEKPVRAGE